MKRALLIVMLVAAGVRAQSAPASQPDAADQLLDEGTRLFTEDTDFEGAARKFEASYAARPSWKALNGIALVREQQLRYLEAIEILQKLETQFGGELTDKQRATVDRRIADLRSRVGAVAYEVVEQPHVLIDGSEPASNPMLVMPGQHSIVATLDGYSPFSKLVDVNPGQTVTVKIELKPQAVKIVVEKQRVVAVRKLPAWLPWGAATLTAIVLGGSAVAYGMSSSDRSAVNGEVKAAYDANCVPTGSGVTCANRSAAQLTTDAELQQMHRSDVEMDVATGLVVGGALAAAGTVALFFINRPHYVIEGPAPEAPRAMIVPQGAGAAFVLRF